MAATVEIQKLRVSLVGKRVCDRCQYAGTIVSVNQAGTEALVMFDILVLWAKERPGATTKIMSIDEIIFL